MFLHPQVRAVVSLAACLAPMAFGGTAAPTQQLPTQSPAPGQGAPIAQTALSLCPALEVVSRESVTPGTALAVSPDGQFQVTYVHTPRGAEITILNRDTQEKKRVDLPLPSLPPGVVWRIHEMAFSTDSQSLAVRSVGAVSVIDTAAAQVRFTIGMDSPTQTYPGKLSWAGSQLAVAFWPPESYLADAETTKPTEIRIYDTPTGNIARRLALPLRSADAWTELRLSPDGKGIAVLDRAHRWPGDARLVLFASDTGKPLWERKIHAEDVSWSADGKQLLALGSELVWLDPRTGKPIRRAETKVPHSDFQKLRINDAVETGIGQFSRYSPFERALGGSKKRSVLVVLWRLDTGKELCRIELNAATSMDAWLTARGELLNLEETYEVRPSLRLLKSARLITYRLAKPAPPTEKPPKPAPSPKEPTKP